MCVSNVSDLKAGTKILIIEGIEIEQKEKSKKNNDKKMRAFISSPEICG